MRKPDIRMSYKNLIACEDSYKKYMTLTRKLLKLQFHGADFFAGLEEQKRLYSIYKEEIKQRLEAVFNKGAIQ